MPIPTWIGSSEVNDLDDSTLSVATWNLWGRYGDYENRAPAIESTIKAVGPDVICLQECWGEREGRGQAEALADACGFPYWHYGWRLDLEHLVGNAILSKHPLDHLQVLPLPGFTDDDMMGCIVAARVNLRFGGVPIITTHLDYRKANSALRQTQIGHVMRAVQSSPNDAYPAVVCGDFNSVPISDEIRMMRGHSVGPVSGLAFQDSWDYAVGDEGEGFTWDLENPSTEAAIAGRSRLDYIFVEAGLFRDRGVPRGTRRFGFAVDGVWPSDHLGVVTTLSLPTPK